MKVDNMGQIIEDSIEKVVSVNEIIQFLRLYVENKHLSLTNLLLLYDQNPKSRMVCGEKAWNQLGRKRKEDAVCVQLILPEVRAGERESYRIVRGYGFDDTEGKEYRGDEKAPIKKEQIMKFTGNNFELVSENPLVRIAVRFIVFENFGIKHTIVKALFGKLQRMSRDEKYAFIQEVILKSRKILDDLEGWRLSFNETAFLNSLLVSSDRTENACILDMAARSTENEEWKEELILLREKLMRTKMECLAELFQRKCQKRLFSFPPVKLETDT